MQNKHFLKRRITLFLLLVTAVLVSCGGDEAAGTADGAGGEEAAVSQNEGGASAVTDTNPAATPVAMDLTINSETDGGVDLPPTPNAAEIALTQAALLPPQEPIDACELLSEEEAAAFLGAEITSVESETGDHTGTCNYIAQTTIDRLHLKISWTPNFGAGDYELVRSMVQNPREEGTDIGDDYYIRDELSGVQLRLVRGEQYLVLEAYGVPEPDGPLKELAQRLLAQIPPGG